MPVCGLVYVCMCVYGSCMVCMCVAECMCVCVRVCVWVSSPAIQCSSQHLLIKLLGGLVLHDVQLCCQCSPTE